MQGTTYELKYCERCGSLRLRRADSAETLLPAVRTSAGQLLAARSHAERAICCCASRTPKPEPPARNASGAARAAAMGGCNEEPLTSSPTAVTGCSSAVTRLPKSVEIDPRPEMLCFRGQTLRHRAALLRTLLPGGKTAFPAGTGVLPRASLASRHSQLRGAGGLRSRRRALSGAAERGARGDDHPGRAVRLSRATKSPEMLRCSRAWVPSAVAEALDALSEIFLQAGLLSEDRPDRRQCQVTNRSIPPDVVTYGTTSSAVARGRRARKPVVHAHQPPAERCQAIPA